MTGNSENWKNIKTIFDVIDVLGKDLPDDIKDGHLNAIQQVKNIRNVLNNGWEPIIGKDDISFPLLAIYPKRLSLRQAHGLLEASEVFTVSNEEYYVVCEQAINYKPSRAISALTDIHMLACKNEEIAKHFGRYFGMYIFNALNYHADGITNVKFNTWLGEVK
jgi:hypothetical protein